jgi:phospholipid transport system substrate-binding protein
MHTLRSKMSLSKLRHALVAPVVLCALLAVAPLAGAGADDGAQAFVQTSHTKLEGLLKQNPSGSRDAQVAALLNSMVDYDELTRRTFGQPCPAGGSSCTNHWSDLTPAQQSEVKDLLRKLVEKNYRKNLVKTLDYEVSYRGAREQGGEAKVRTEAKSKAKPRDPALQIDYVVRGAGGDFHIVDIVTEGSSLSKNYYDQFHRMLTNPEQGYPFIVKKLTEKLSKD